MALAAQNDGNEDGSSSVHSPVHHLLPGQPGDKIPEQRGTFTFKIATHGRSRCHSLDGDDSARIILTNGSKGWWRDAPLFYLCLAGYGIAMDIDLGSHHACRIQVAGGEVKTDLSYGHPSFIYTSPGHLICPARVTGCKDHAPCRWDDE